MKTIKILNISSFILSLLSIGCVFLPAIFFIDFNSNIVTIPFYTLIFGGSITFDVNNTIFFDINLWIIITYQLVILSGIAALLGINRIGNTLFSLILSALGIIGSSLTLIFINIINPSFLINDVYLHIGTILLIVIASLISIFNLISIIVKKNITIKHH